jgi:hypothetical protein
MTNEYSIDAFVRHETDWHANGGFMLSRSGEILTPANLARLEAASELLRALDACETMLSPHMISHDCGDAPRPGQRCNECIGCAVYAAWMWATAALTKARSLSSRAGA